MGGVRCQTTSTRLVQAQTTGGGFKRFGFPLTEDDESFLDPHASSPPVADALLAFSLPDPNPADQHVDTLVHALSRTLWLFPPLGGRVKTARSKRGKHRIVCSDSGVPLTVVRMEVADEAWEPKSVPAVAPDHYFDHVRHDCLLDDEPLMRLKWTVVHNAAGVAQGAVLAVSFARVLCDIGCMSKVLRCLATYSRGEKVKHMPTLQRSMVDLMVQQGAHRDQPANGAWAHTLAAAWYSVRTSWSDVLHGLQDVLCGPRAADGSGLACLVMSCDDMRASREFYQHLPSHDQPEDGRPSNITTGTSATRNGSNGKIGFDELAIAAIVAHWCPPDSDSRPSNTRSTLQTLCRMISPRAHSALSHLTIYRDARPTLALRNLFGNCTAAVPVPLPAPPPSVHHSHPAAPSPAHLRSMIIALRYTHLHPHHFPSGTCLHPPHSAPPARALPPSRHNSPSPDIWMWAKGWGLDTLPLFPDPIRATPVTMAISPRHARLLRTHGSPGGAIVLLPAKDTVRLVVVGPRSSVAAVVRAGRDARGGALAWGVSETADEAASEAGGYEWGAETGRPVTEKGRSWRAAVLVVAVTLSATAAGVMWARGGSKKGPAAGRAH